METLTTRPLNVWNKYSIRPGPVGSVGDVLIQTKLKHSAPDLPERYEIFNGKDNSKFYGSNVNDGTYASFTSGGGPAKSLGTLLPYRRGYKTSVGWLHQDIVPVDRSRTSKMGSVGQYGYKSKVASVYRAKTTGELFLPSPEGYSLLPNQTPRGTQIPQIISTSFPDTLPPTKQGLVSGLHRDGIKPNDEKRQKTSILEGKYKNK